MRKFRNIGIVLLLLLLPSVVGAANIGVLFSPDPLFNETNYRPGNKVEDRFAEVANYTNEPQQVVLGVQNVISDSKDMLVGLNILVYQNSSLVWSGSLDDLQRIDFAPLLVLGAGDTTRYDFAAEMKTDLANDAQGGRVQFDLWIGFVTENSEGETIITTPTGSVGSGGASGFLAQTLQISGEGVRNITATSTGFDVTIGWTTNLPSNSGIVYGPVEDGPFVLDIGQPLLGYPLGLNQDALVTAHELILANLSPGEYRYRVASSNGQLTTSPEYVFVLNETGQISDGLVLGASDFRGQTPSGTGFIKKAVQDLFFSESLPPGEVAGTSTSGEQGVGANSQQNSEVLSLVKSKKPSCWPTVWFVFVLTLFLSLVNHLIWYRQSPVAETRKKSVFLKSFVILSLVALATIALLGLWCVFWRLLLPLGAVFFLLLFYKERNR